MSSYSNADGAIFDVVGALGMASAPVTAKKIAAAIKEGKTFTQPALAFWLEYTGQRLGCAEREMTEFSRRAVVWRDTEARLKKEVAEANERTKIASDNSSRLARKVQELEQSRYADPYGEIG